ncbi:MAG: hypothetical protein GY884_05060, partial [Proteobacteria bacterium]|nr:hypothetical protein [Pseudomonadota bacterium]
QLAAVPGLPPAVGWYHHNGKSVGPEDLFRIQGLTAWYETHPDPLLHRTFGAVVTAAGGGRRVDERTLRAGARILNSFRLTVHTEHPATPESWLEATARLVDEPRATDTAFPALESSVDRMRRHTAWWQDFANRSWIHVERSRAASAPLLPTNDLPLYMGQDQTGGSAFEGQLVRVAIRRGVTPPVAGVWDQPDARPEDTLLDVRWPIGHPVADVDLD